MRAACDQAYASRVRAMVEEGNWGALEPDAEWSIELRSKKGAVFAKFKDVRSEVQNLILPGIAR
jgi:hypothetical protein